MTCAKHRQALSQASCPFVGRGGRSPPFSLAARLSIRTARRSGGKNLLFDRFGDGSFALQIVGTAAAFFDFVVLLAHSTPVTGIIHSVNQTSAPTRLLFWRWANSTWNCSGLGAGPFTWVRPQ